MIVELGDGQSKVKCKCGNEAEVTEAMVTVLDMAMKLEIKCEHCNERFVIKKGDVNGDDPE